MTLKLAKRIKDVDYSKAAHEYYQAYATETLEDRAISDGVDGMKPVIRRTLWAAYQMGARSTKPHIKTARVVGEVLGKYHPHGDAACHEAIVNYTERRTPFPLFDGSGTWGSFSNPAYASMRYTSTRIHALAETVLFDPHYLAVTDLVPNYDGNEQEPVRLPALVPMLLLNAKLGIAPGVSVDSPEFEFMSVLEAIKLRTAQKEPLTAEQLAKTLRFTSRYGGVVNKEGNSTKEVRAIMKTGAGRVVYSSRLLKTFKDGKNVVMRYTRFAPLPELDKLLPKLLALKGVKTAYDASTTADVYGSLDVVLESHHDAEGAIAKSVDKALSANATFRTYVADRSLGQDEVNTQLRCVGIVTIFEEWYQFRLNLEKRASAYWANEVDKRVAKIDLCLLACSQLDFLVSVIKNRKHTVADMEAIISKKLKVSIDDAKFLLSRTLLQLRALNADELVAEKKKELAHKEELAKWSKAPSLRVKSNVESLTTMWAKYTKVSK